MHSFSLNECTVYDENLHEKVYIGYLNCHMTFGKKMAAVQNSVFCAFHRKTRAPVVIKLVSSVLCLDLIF